MASSPLPSGLEIVTRKEWVAYLADLGDQPLQKPVSYVRLTYTGGNGCYDKESCIKRTKQIQFDQMYHNGIADIAYNFLIGCDGRVYAGRGWEVVAERDTEHEFLKHTAIDICFIGSYKEKEPPSACLETAELLIKYGIDCGHIAADFQLLGHELNNKSTSSYQ